MLGLWDFGVDRLKTTANAKVAKDAKVRKGKLDGYLWDWWAATYACRAKMQHE